MTRPARLLTPLATALDRLLDGLRPVVPSRAPLAAGLGAVLAEPLAAPGPVPARAVALRAGWAVASHDTVGASSYAPAVPSLRPVAVEAGEPLPPGADAVLDPGDVARDGILPEILAVAAPGQGARRMGEDAPAGAVLRAAGERLRPLDIAIARAVGLAEAEIRRPRVAVWSGRADAAALALALEVAAGAEIAETDGPPQGADLVVGLGADVLAAGIAHLSDRGGLVGHGIAMAPGGEAACGLMAGAPVLLLPGRIEDAFAGLQLLARPCLDRLAGAAPRRPRMTAPLLAKLSSAVGVAEIALLRREDGGWRPLGVGDLAWSALSSADAWTLIGPEREGHGTGETLAAFAMDAAP